jgi:hypothetical protein
MKRSVLIYIGLSLLGLALLAGGLQAAFLGPAEEWEKSKHNNRATTLVHATVEARSAGAAHCARCHSEQGFRAWLPQLLAGNPGPIAKPDGSAADVPFLTGLELTREKAQPITCTACHGEGFALRVQNTTPLLPAGFAATAVGKGALCMTCHNTRNGRITWNTEDPKRYTAPHASAQTDVIMGKNAFFLDDTGERASAHGVFVRDSCVSCHMTLTKAPHSFRAAENNCANCHGPVVTKEFVQQPITELHKRLKAAIEKRVLAVKEKITTVRAYDPAKATYTPNVAVDGKQITGIDITSVGGQITFILKMADGKEIYSQLGDIKDAPGDPGKVVFATADPIVRAAWNYILIKYDRSMGVHNPTFTREMLLATLRALP